MKGINYKFKPYTNEDYQFVYDAKKLGYQKYVEEFFGPWDDAQQYEMYESFLSERKDKIQIIVVEGNKAGFIDGGLLEDGSYGQGNICLIPEFRRKGIGSDILKNLIKTYPDKNITLRVFKSNPAVKLYERFGFKIVEETKAHFNMVRKPK